MTAEYLTVSWSSVLNSSWSWRRIDVKSFFTSFTASAAALTDTSYTTQQSPASVCVWRPLAEKSTANQRKERIVKKYIHSVNYNTVTDNKGLSLFIYLLLPPKSVKVSENSNL